MGGYRHYQKRGLSTDIQLAAQSSATVIILMAMSKLEQITEIFATHGKSETPVAIIQNGTLPDQKMITGQVKDIYFRSQHAGLKNPAIIIIGEVVSLARNYPFSNRYNSSCTTLINKEDGLSLFIMRIKKTLRQSSLFYINIV
ncbi:SAM-dependent methyltransferase [Niabella sp. W65]|nr:SAM-dependent methyltransferase [Niabella sp. W65]MCH7362445.1 SAM-dependent methyltransferase [Niabella sp. W65]ULT38404.1 SAM-dependent methyltransferase [Niabella sp. I65]